MAVLKEMFKEEKERLLKMKKFYEDKIIELPKGSIIFKQRGAKKYPYMVYREGKKVRTKYLKLNINDLDKLKFNLDKRKKYLKLLKAIKEDLKVFGNIKNEWYQENIKSSVPESRKLKDLYATLTKKQKNIIDIFLKENLLELWFNKIQKENYS